MAWSYYGKAIPLIVYYGVPPGWYAHEIRVEHARLGGTFDLTASESTNGVNLTWMPERRLGCSAGRPCTESRMA